MGKCGSQRVEEKKACLLSLVDTQCKLNILYFPSYSKLQTKGTLIQNVMVPKNPSRHLKYLLVENKENKSSLMTQSPLGIYSLMK